MRAVDKSAHGSFEDGFEEILVLGAAGGEALEPLGDEGGGGGGFGISGGGWGGDVFVAVVTAGGSMGELRASLGERGSGWLVEVCVRHCDYCRFCFEKEVFFLNVGSLWFGSCNVGSLRISEDCHRLIFLYLSILELHPNNSNMLLSQKFGPVHAVMR